MITRVLDKGDDVYCLYLGGKDPLKWGIFAATVSHKPWIRDTDGELLIPIKVQPTRRHRARYPSVRREKLWSSWADAARVLVQLIDIAAEETDAKSAALRQRSKWLRWSAVAEHGA
jgi:hypothetical protein